MRQIFLWTMLLVISVIPPSTRKSSDEQEVAAMLDDWYDAADKGDGRRYFSHFTDNAVFLGTDPEERWPLPEFRARYESIFDGHHAWTYNAKERHMRFSVDHRMGWFDEKLVSPKYGELRGTGVVVKSHNTWKIEQYSLTFLIPNSLIPKVMEALR